MVFVPALRDVLTSPLATPLAFENETEMNPTRKTKLSWMRTLARAKLPTGERERLALFYFICKINGTDDWYVNWREMARICNCTWEEARDMCRDFTKRGWLPPGDEISPQQHWKMKKRMEA